MLLRGQSALVTTADSTFILPGWSRTQEHQTFGWSVFIACDAERPPLNPFSDLGLPGVVGLHKARICRQFALPRSPVKDYGPKQDRTIWS